MKNFLKILVFIFCICIQTGTYALYSNTDITTWTNVDYITRRWGIHTPQENLNMYPISVISARNIASLTREGNLSTIIENWISARRILHTPKHFFILDTYKFIIYNKENGETDLISTIGGSWELVFWYCWDNYIKLSYRYNPSGQLYYNLLSWTYTTSNPGCVISRDFYLPLVYSNNTVWYADVVYYVTDRNSRNISITSYFTRNTYVQNRWTTSMTVWNTTWISYNNDSSDMPIPNITGDNVYAYSLIGWKTEESVTWTVNLYVSLLMSDNTVQNYVMSSTCSNNNSCSQRTVTQIEETKFMLYKNSQNQILYLTCDSSHICTDIARGEVWGINSSYKRLQVWVYAGSNWFMYYSRSNGQLLQTSEGITISSWDSQFTQWTLTPSVTTSWDCTTKYITRNDSQCKYLDNTVTATCETQDDWIYTHCLIENDNIQIDAYNLLDVQNPANILFNTAIEDVFTFRDSNWIFTRGSSQPVFKIKTKNENNKISMLYMYDNNLTSEDDYEAYNVVMYPYNQDLWFLSEIGAQTWFIWESFKINNATFLGANINSFSLLISWWRMFTQQTYKLSFWIYGPCSATYQTTVCKWSDWYVYIDWEKTGEINDNIDNIQERVDSVYTPDRINDMWITPSMNSSIWWWLCWWSYNRRDVWDFSWIDILTIIPCWIPYVAQKAYNLFKRMFTFNFNLNKEKETEGFWDWVRNNAGALLPYKAEAADNLINSEWIGYEWEGNEQVNNIMNAWGNNSTTRINENTLWLATILFKVIINIAAFVFMLTCFTKQSENYSWETLIWAGLKVFLFIFFIFIVITLEFIVQYTDLNPLGLNAIFNFIDFGYRTAIEMMLIGVLWYTTRNFI